MNSELLKAERALARGDVDEARVHAWNALATITPEEGGRLRQVAEEIGDPALVKEMDRWGLPPEEPEATKAGTPFQIRGLIFPLAIMALLLVLAINSFFSEATAPDVSDAETALVTPQRSPLTTQTDGVWLVRIGNSERVPLRKLANDVSLRYGIPVGLLPEIDPLPEHVVNEKEEELDGDLLLSLLRQSYGAREHATIIGITDYPMLSNELALRRPFMLRGWPNYAVVSTADLGANVLARLRGHTRYERTRKLVGRGIGFLYLGRLQSSDPHSLLRPQMSGTDDIDALDERL